MWIAAGWVECVYYSTQTNTKKTRKIPSNESRGGAKTFMANNKGNILQERWFTQQMMLENLDVHMPKKNAETDFMPFMKINSKAREMAQWVKTCAAKPGDLTWILGTNIVEGEN